MEISPELDSYPLCRFFLSGYLAKKQDHGNFPPDDPGKFQRYEKLFASALQALSLQPEALRRRPEFNFDSGDENNLESGIAILRIVVFLTEKNFLRIALIPSTSTTGADITCEGNGQKVCCEVKAITKTSSGRTGLFLEDQVYEKIRESIPKARRQLKATAAQLECQIVIAVFVMNWLLHSFTLDQSDFQKIVNRLEQDQELDGIDGVMVLTATGDPQLFLKRPDALGFPK